MLRGLVLALLLANAAFFAWWQGWLAPTLPPPSDAREPERLAAQVRPEAVTVLSPVGEVALTTAAAVAASAASAPPVAAAEPPQCLEIGPLSEAAAVSAEASLARLGVPAGSVVREAVWTQHAWGVVIAHLSDRDTVRARAAELRRQGVPTLELVAPPALLPGLRLGIYSDRQGAETGQAVLAKKGVRGTSVALLPVGVPTWWLRAPRADRELQVRLKLLPADRLPDGFKPCKG